MWTVLCVCVEVEVVYGGWSKEWREGEREVREEEEEEQKQEEADYGGKEAWRGRGSVILTTKEENIKEK